MNGKIEKIMTGLIVAGLLLAGCAVPADLQVGSSVEKVVEAAEPVQEDRPQPAESEEPETASDAAAALEEFYAAYLDLARQPDLTPAGRWQRVEGQLTPGFADFLLETDFGTAMDMNGFDLLLGSSLVPVDVKVARTVQESANQAAVRVAVSYTHLTLPTNREV